MFKSWRFETIGEEPVLVQANHLLSFHIPLHFTLPQDPDSAEALHRPCLPLPGGKSQGEAVDIRGMLEGGQK